MSDNLVNLKNYRIQLQQVESGLVNDPDNEELLKLQTDLLEIIDLTMQLMSPEEIDQLHNESDSASKHRFKAGDFVMAPWSEDGQFYEAQIEDLTTDGQCTVIFRLKKKVVSEVCLIDLLKPLQSKNRNANGEGSSGGNGGGYRISREIREAKLVKQQKREARRVEIDQSREKDKMNWKNFSNKIGKSKTGAIMKKKSIFATPDSIRGRVGVGTCNIGGKGMTEYQQKQEQVKKPKLQLPKFSILGEDGKAPNAMNKATGHKRKRQD